MRIFNVLSEVIYKCFGFITDGSEKWVQFPYVIFIFRKLKIIYYLKMR